MNIQLGGGVPNYELQRDLFGHPSLEDNASIGVLSDDTCDQDGETAASENGDTDYDLNEDDFEEEEEEDEDEDESCDDDDSQIHALIDDLELKFRTLVSTKIGEAEQFFDDAGAFQRFLSQTASIEVKNPTGSGSLGNTNQEHNGGELGRQSAIVETNIIQNENQTSGNLDRSSCNDASTQTDAFISQSFISLKGTHDETEPKEAPEQARIEISQLRDVRESLITQRQQWAAQLKQAEEKSEDEMKVAECKVYEIEEAIEAVDTAIEFKNEVVLGQPPNKSMIGSITPGTNEAELVTRLESLTIEELRRLLCIYFAKVVELRSSSRRLEKQLEDAENSNDQFSRRLLRDHKYMREMTAEFQARIRLILSSNNANSGAYTCFKRMDEQLGASLKKQQQLEIALTELLVRHGYLVGGADYDVKQVARMLGIEGRLAGGTTNRAQDGAGASAVVPYQPVPSRSTLQKGHKGSSHLGHRRNGRQLDGHELSRIHRDRDTRLENWDHREHREREHRHAAQPSQPAEVRREKRRLIIQPGGGTSGGGGSSSSSHGHGGGPSSHYWNNHPHHSSHGSHYHGYK